MPLHLPFNFPYFYNNYRYPKYSSRPNSPNLHYNNNNNIQNNTINNNTNNNNNDININKNKVNQKNDNINNNANYSRTNKKTEQKNAEDSETLRSSTESSEYFFEIFGLKIHFDDILIICILFFLYKEEVHDEELFLCLILLLIS